MGDEAAAVTLYSDREKNRGRFPNNYIRTTKYTLLTFLPVNLFEQFRKVSNAYFLVNMTIALLPGVSPIFPITSILPLVFVLSVAAIKDAIEDYRRYKADKKKNGALSVVVRNGEQLKVRSDVIEVGDYVRMERNQEFPADMLVLATSIDDGICYIETANLDGETNIKPRAAVKDTAHLTDAQTLCSTEIIVVCDPPNESLVKWEGILEINGVRKPLGLENILFRGCKLRNTQWAYGLVVYAGVHTKMFRNLKKKATKFSGLDKKLNKLILSLLCIQQLIIIILSASSVRFKNEQGLQSPHLVYFYEGLSGFKQFWLNYLTFFVLLSFMMPISLFVSMELCKAFQAKFMELDVRMATAEKTMKAKTSNLNEELSQAKYIFTDKTGTLTENEMRFHRCVVLGFAHTEADNPGGIRHHLLGNGKYREAITEFMKTIALCHTVVISRDEKTKERLYEGQSTDEVALVTAAKANGFVLTDRTSQMMEVEIMDAPHRFEVLAILDFTPERKRMSVILRAKNGDICLMMKGADSTTIPIVCRNTQDELKWYHHILKELDLMAKEGLRTLVVATKKIPEAEFAKWKVEYDKASLAMKNRAEAVEEACCQIEKDVNLIGCSGIEDRLQDCVPETIHYFLQAGLIIWVLTGDKRETAVNIAASSRLVDAQNDVIHHLEASTQDEMKAQLEDVMQKTQEELASDKKVTIVVDGATLELAMSPRFQEEFKKLGVLVNSAVCCRVTPLQKANVVAMFQKMGHTALSVGDGANDVSMIQEAKVGVGIMGLEGSQAELASDYAIPKFRHLVRLVAVHGRFCLVRNAILIQYSFYKNLVLALTQVFFSFYNGFSGQTLFDSWVMTFFNIAFTALPPLIMGIFEKDLHDHVIEKNPMLFIDLSKGQNFNIKTLIPWGLSSIVHSCVIYFIVTATFPQDDINAEQTSDIWMQGSVAMTLVVMVVLAKNAMVTRHWTWIQVTGLLLSTLMYFAATLFYSSFPLFFGSANYYYVAFVLFKTTKFYLWIILFVFGLLTPDFTFMYLRRRMWPSYRDVVQEQYAKRSVPADRTPTTLRASSLPGVRSGTDDLHMASVDDTPP